jgi:hypothetical protein
LADGWGKAQYLLAPDPYCSRLEREAEKIKLLIGFLELRLLLLVAMAIDNP